MSIEAVLTSVTIGLLATTRPCVLPLYPGYLAYLSGQAESSDKSFSRYLTGFFVLTGVLTMMLALGLLIALLSVSIGRALSLVIPLADITIIGLGILLLVDINIFARLPQMKIPVLSNRYVNAFLYGLLYGPIALPCSGPLLVGIFAFSLTTEEAINKLATFLLFGLGFGLRLLALSFLSGAAQRWIIHQFTRHTRILNLLGGLLLIGVGSYDLAQNWAMIMEYL